MISIRTNLLCKLTIYTVDQIDKFIGVIQRIYFTELEVVVNKPMIPFPLR